MYMIFLLVSRFCFFGATALSTLIIFVFILDVVFATLFWSTAFISTDHIPEILKVIGLLLLAGYAINLIIRE